MNQLTRTALAALVALSVFAAAPSGARAEVRVAAGGGSAFAEGSFGLRSGPSVFGYAGAHYLLGRRGLAIGLTGDYGAYPMTTTSITESGGSLDRTGAEASLQWAPAGWSETLTPWVDAGAGFAHVALNRPSDSTLGGNGWTMHVGTGIRAGVSGPVQVELAAAYYLTEVLTGDTGHGVPSSITGLRVSLGLSYAFGAKKH